MIFFAFKLNSWQSIKLNKSFKLMVYLYFSKIKCQNLQKLEAHPKVKIKFWFEPYNPRTLMARVEWDHSVILLIFFFKKLDTGHYFLLLYG